MKLTGRVYVYFKVNIKRPFNFPHVTYSWNDGSLFLPLKKTKIKNSNCDILSHNFFSELRYKHAIVSYKVQLFGGNDWYSKNRKFISQFWLNLQFRVIKSELRDINSQFWEKSHNCELISHNSEKKVRIARCKLTMTFFIQWQKWTSTHNVASNYWFNRLGTDWIVKVGVPFQNDVVGGCGLFVSG